LSGSHADRKTARRLHHATAYYVGQALRTKGTFSANDELEP